MTAGRGYTEVDDNILEDDDFPYTHSSGADEIVITKAGKAVVSGTVL